MVAVRLQPEHRAQEEQRRPGRPCLRAACRGVLHRVLRLLAGIAAERLGQPAVEELGGIEDPRGDLRRLVLEPVATEAPRDERVVEGPDGSGVVPDRVVAPLSDGQRPHAPAGEEPRPEQVPRDRTCFRLVDDPAPQKVAVVRRERVDLPSVLVEGEREVLAVLDPEVAVEPAFQVRRVRCELVGERRVLPDLTGETRAAYLGVVGVALQLARCPREAWKLSAAERDRVPRVLPALVLEP